MAKHNLGKRSSGILLPIFSLPSRYGIGTYGQAAYDFVDFLKAGEQTYWQILPMGPTGYADSPYQSFSTYALNPYLTDPEFLIRDGLLKKQDCEALDFGKKASFVDYGLLFQNRRKLLLKAFQNSGLFVSSSASADSKMAQEYAAFVKENEGWLNDYALFMVLKDHHDGKPWSEWEQDLKLRKEKALQEIARKYDEDVNFYRFCQFIARKQWNDLKRYANENGISIIGDIPIYVAFDSADTWANPELFLLDEKAQPIDVAGCPPDAFSATGQLWGNPIYRWDYHKKTGFAWWMNRLRAAFDLVDVLRIDHFRGFDSFWAVPGKDETAMNGEWRKGPGFDLFETMQEKLGDRKVIAEDLGYLTPSVKRLLKKTGFPGMKVLQFAFDSREESDYLPHHYGTNCVVYTGTHDNNTTAGWIHELSARDRKFAKEYLNVSQNKKIPDAMIRTALMSVAETVVIPMQDYLEVGEEGRINMPSTVGRNWTWRMQEGTCTKELAAHIRDLTSIYGRCSRSLDTKGKKAKK